MANSNSGKLAIIALIVLLIVALAAAGLGFSSLQQEKQTTAKLTKDLMKLEDEKKNAENKIKDLIRSLDEAKDSLKSSEARVTSLTDELDNEKKAKDAALEETGRVKSELDQVKNLKSQLEAKVRDSEANLNKAKEELATIKTTKESLEQKIKDLEAKPESVQLDNIVISGQPSESGGFKNKAVSDSANTVAVSKNNFADKSQENAKDGKVLVVNGEYDFVVVNLGSKDNVSVGDVLDINHKNKKIGQAKIEEVRDTMSVATPVTEGLMKQVKEEDAVTVVR